jgi:hypothetical protein
MLDGLLPHPTKKIAAISAGARIKNDLNERMEDY